MKPRHWIGVTMVSLPCLWVIFISLSPLFFNGHIYHIEQPVPVSEVSEEEVIVLVSRTSLMSLPATCAREMECERLIQFPERSCPIEKGHNNFTLSMPLPKEAQGMCVYRGIVTYRPFGTFGPDLSYAWKTEPFEIPERR